MIRINRILPFIAAGFILAFSATPAVVSTSDCTYCSSAPHNDPEVRGITTALGTILAEEDLYNAYCSASLRTSPITFQQTVETEIESLNTQESNYDDFRRLKQAYQSSVAIQPWGRTVDDVRLRYNATETRAYVVEPFMKALRFDALRVKQDILTQAKDSWDSKLVFCENLLKSSGKNLKALDTFPTDRSDILAIGLEAIGGAIEPHTMLSSLSSNETYVQSVILSDKTVSMSRLLEPYDVRKIDEAFARDADIRNFISQRVRYAINVDELSVLTRLLGIVLKTKRESKERYTALDDLSKDQDRIMMRKLMALPATNAKTFFASPDCMLLIGDYCQLGQQGKISASARTDGRFLYTVHR